MNARNAEHDSDELRIELRVARRTIMHAVLWRSQCFEIVHSLKTLSESFYTNLDQ
jgi:hypothetical protein